MILPVRSFLGLSILVVSLAACGTAASPSAEPSTPAATEPADPSATPADEPSEEPTTGREVAGTITMVGGMIMDGPGESIGEAIAAGRAEPTLVNGVLFMDTDGTIYLASGLADASTPTFEGPMLEVIGFPENVSDWDPEKAAVTGLQEANGILFFEARQLQGIVDA